MVNPRVFRLIGYRTGSVFSDEPTGPASEAVYVEDTTAVVGHAGEPLDTRIEASLRYLENRELNAYAAARYNEPQEPPCPTK